MSDDDNILVDNEIIVDDFVDDDTNWKDFYNENVTSLRSKDIILPETITVLEKPCGSKVYLVGTAHFSQDSIDDVVKIIDQTIPDCVVLELCIVRSKMLQMDEETLKEEMRKANLWESIKKQGHVAGVMYYLMLRMSNHVMTQMNMLPGGEFRAAFQKAKEFPCCHVSLGDRRVDVTLKRALASLGLGGRLKFFFTLLMGLKPISKEEIEKMKKADILEQLLKELGSEFPSLSRVIIDERDLFLTKSIWDSVKPVDDEGEIPSVNVAVVGIGHCIGITKYWSQAADIDQKKLCEIEKPPLSWTLFLQSLRVGLLSVVGVVAYKLCYLTYCVMQPYLNGSA